MVQDTQDLLRIRGLGKRYGAFELRDVDLAVPAGAVVGLVGSNGAGKTTTIKAALGLVRPDAGLVELFGTRVTGEGAVPPAERARLHERVGVVFDAVSLPRSLSVRDVRGLMRAAYAGWDDAAFARYTAAFGLADSLRVEQLSRGMGMKLMLACALSHGAELLVLDEATAGLDPLAREEALGFIRQYLEVEGRGVLLSTHITSDLERIADYVVCVDAGRVVFALEKDAITEVAGIARCRAGEYEQVVASGMYAPGELRVRRNPYGVDVLVPDRRAFGRAFGQVAVDRATIEEYMALTLKGEVAC